MRYAAKTAFAAALAVGAVAASSGGAQASNKHNDCTAYIKVTNVAEKTPIILRQLKGTYTHGTLKKLRRGKGNEKGFYVKLNKKKTDKRKADFKLEPGASVTFKVTIRVDEKDNKAQFMVGYDKMKRRANNGTRFFKKGTNYWSGTPRFGKRACSAMDTAAEAYPLRAGRKVLREELGG